MAFTPETLRAKYQLKNPLIANLLSEFYGTFLLLFLGIGIVCQFDLSHKSLNTWIQVNIGWGFAIMFVVLCCSRTSGGHYNPAVSLIMVTFGNLRPKDFFLYCIVQTIGAFLGSGAAFLVYYDQFLHYTGGGVYEITGPKATAGLFCSFPAAHVSNLTAFVDQFVGTGLLGLFAAVIIDKRNKIPGWLHPLFFGFLVMMIGMSFGMNIGYPINPARDFGPRLLTALLYGPGVFSYHDYYFWIPVIAPLPGALFGAWSYHIFVGAHIRDEVEADVKYALNERELQPLNGEKA